MKSAIALGVVMCGVLACSSPDAKHMREVATSRSAPAQDLAIPQILSQGVTEKVVDAPTGSFDDSVRTTDVIVTGSVGSQVTTLSSDELDIYTDYELRNVQVRYQTGPLTSSSSGSPATLTVSQAGGKRLVGGTEFVETVNGVSRLDAGVSYLLLLQSTQGKLVVMNGFRVSTDRLVPIVERSDYARAYRTMPASDAIAAIVEGVRAGRTSR